MPSGQKRKGRELRDADVGWVSLVPRGANGEPFRVVKSEDGMSIDLAQVFKGAPKAAPAVAFVAIAKGFDIDAAKELIEKNGLETDNVSETETATLFTQGDFNIDLDGDAVQVLKLSDAVAVGVTGVDVQKSFDELNFESTSFQEVLQQHGALPMIYTAKMALGDTLHNILRNGGDQGDTIDLVEKAVDDFKGYVSGVLSAVPDTAFKMDAALVETPVKKADVETAEKSDEETPEDAKTDDASVEDDDVEKGGMGKRKPKKDEDEDAEKGGKSKYKKSDEAGEDDGSETIVDKSEGGEQPSEDADPSALEAMMTSINALAESVNALSDNTTTAIKSVEDKVDAVVGRVEKTETALKGAVPTVLDDAEVAKSDEDLEDEDAGVPDFANLDTAYGNPFRS